MKHSRLSGVWALAGPGRKGGVDGTPDVSLYPSGSGTPKANAQTQRPSLVRESWLQRECLLGKDAEIMEYSDGRGCRWSLGVRWCFGGNKGGKGPWGRGPGRRWSLGQGQGREEVEPEGGNREEMWDPGLRQGRGEFLERAPPPFQSSG